MKGKTDRKTKTDPQSASLKKPEYSSLEETLEPALDELCMMDDVNGKQPRSGCRRTKRKHSAYFCTKPYLARP